MHKILVFNTEQDAEKVLESYFEKNDATHEKLEDALSEKREESRNNPDSQDSRKNAGNGLEFTLLVQLYAVESGFQYLTDGISNWRMADSYETMVEFVEGIRKEIGRTTSHFGAYGARVVPVLYTVEERFTGSDFVDEKNISDLRRTLKEDAFSTSPPEERQGRKDLVDYFLEALTSLKDMHEQGLSEQQRQEFECLFYQKSQ